MKKPASIAAALALILGTGGAAVAAPNTPDGGPSSAPDIAALAGPLASQEVAWGDCDFGSARLNQRFADAECATIKVPRDWHNPTDGATFDIRISRVQTVDPNSPEYKGTITANPGGPGGDGLVWGPGIASFMPDLHGSYNFIGFDPRGVGQSTHGVCDAPVAELEAAETDEQLYQVLADCQNDPDVRAVNTEQTVYDMDFIRYLNDVPKLSFVGYSYGTWLGSWYGAVFGDNADKFVLDSSTGVMDETLERTFDIQAYARDRQFDEHLVNWIARHDSTYGLGEVPSQVRERYINAQDYLGDDLTGYVWSQLGATSAFPNNSNYPAAGQAVQVMILVAEDAQAEDEVEGAAGFEAMTRDQKLAWLDTKLKSLEADDALADTVKTARANIAAERQESNELAAELQQEETVELDIPFYWIMCQDGQFNPDVSYQQARADQRSADNPVSRAFGTTGLSPCTFFDTDLKKPAAGANFPTTILIQSELDSQTAWELGYEGGKQLPNTTFIAVDNEGSHGLFPYGHNVVDRPVVNMFKTGTVPRRDVVAQALPLPNDSETWESWQRLNVLAKHVGANEDNPYQPIRKNGNGHPLLFEQAKLREQLQEETGVADPEVKAAEELDRLAEVSR